MSKKRIDIDCGYCGITWTPKYYASRPACPKCNEQTNLQIRESNEVTSDIFGYRFDPPFPEELQKSAPDKRVGDTTTPDFYDERYLGGD